MTTDLETASALRDAALARGAKDPRWLADARERALQAYEAAPLPDRVLHLWRYTDPAKLLPRGRLPQEPGTSFGELPEDCHDATFSAVCGYLLARDGRVLRTALDPMVADKGVMIGDLCNAAREHEDLVRPRLFGLANPAGDKFENLSAALFAGGTFVQIPRRVALDRPLHIAHRVDGDGLLVSRSLVIAGEASEATLVFDLTSVQPDASPLLHEGLELYLEAGAQLRVVFVQAFGRKVAHAPVIRCSVERDASLETVSVALGGGLVKSQQTAEIVGRGASVRALGIVFGSGRQHFDHHTLQDHVAGHASSNLDYRTVVAQRARSVYTGNLRIGLEGIGSDAHQRNHNLLLSDTARADTIPELEILTNDVTCSHAAACGPLDEEVIYYCTSRGFTEEQARKLIVTGFLEPVVERVPSEALQQRVRNALAERLEAVD